MISSEVQRTLVKSPPELWAELSDPDSLARHLGELGEIRITRTEPEKLIEWEAQDTTGTVAIKASGWGTKVILTVNRELTAAPEAPSEDLAAESPAREELAAESPAAEADQPIAEAAPEPGPVASPGEDLDLAVEVPASEHTPGPETEAARRAAGWPEDPAAGPAIESDLRAAETEEALATPGWSTEEVSSIVEPDEPVPSAITEIEAAPETEPRRGFFARLFGRRRKPEPANPPEELDDRAEAEADAAVELEAAIEPEPEAEAAAPREPALATEPAPALAAEPEPEPEPALAAELEPAPAPAPALAAELEPALPRGMRLRSFRRARLPRPRPAPSPLPKPSRRRRPRARPPRAPSRSRRS